MKRAFAAILPLAVFLTAVLTSASASPYSELQRSEQKFAALRSFHADMELRKLHSLVTTDLAIDFVAPDRFRETMPRNVIVTVIGSQVFMNVGGRVMTMPSGMPSPIESQLQNIRTLGLRGNFDNNIVVETMGEQMLDGQPTHRYHLRWTTLPNYLVDLWIGANELPVQSVITTTASTITIRYSGFNAATVIDTP